MLREQIDVTANASPAFHGLELPEIMEVLIEDKAPEMSEIDQRNQRLLEDYLQSKDPDVLVELIEGNRGFVEATANRFTNRGGNREDVVQIGMMGFFLAVLRFEPEKGKFYSFAKRTIEGEMQHYFRDKADMIKRPRSLYDLYPLVQKMIAYTLEWSGHEPTDHEIATVLSVPIKDVAEVRARATSADSVVSIESLNKTDDGGLERLAARSVASSFEDTLAISLDLQEVLRKIEPKSREILIMRFIDDLKPHEIAARLNVTSGRVSHLVKLALNELRGVLELAA